MDRSNRRTRCILIIQGKLDRPEFEHHQIVASVASVATAQNHQARAQAQSRLRLRRQLAEERIQHLDRLHALPLYLCRRGRPALQRQVLLLHRRKQTHTRGLPVSLVTFSGGYRHILAVN